MNKPDIKRIKKLISELIPARTLNEVYLNDCIEYIEFLEKEKTEMRYDFNSTLEHIWRIASNYVSGVECWESEKSILEWITSMIAKYKFV